MNTDRMLEILAACPKKEESKQRQIATWKYEDVDRLPIIFPAATPELKDAPRYNMQECYESKEKMLHQALFQMISFAKSPADGVPSLRANTGTGTVATTFGIEQRVFPDKLPWICEHLTKEQISKMEPSDFEDIATMGIIPQVLEYQKYFRQKLNGHAGIFLSDTQGPFDNAHLVRGSDILTDVYDDPPFVHHLLELATAAYIAATKAMKANLGESDEEGPHIGAVYLSRGAVRCCEDTPVILSPKLIDEFVVPYTKRALGAFGGGYVHYCGRNDHLFKVMAEQPEVHGFNMGMVHLQDMDLIMSTLLPRRQVYYGVWPRKGEKSLKKYFSKIMETLGGQKKGLILQPVLTAEDRQDLDKVMDVWAEVQ